MLKNDADTQKRKYNAKGLIQKREEGNEFFISSHVATLQYVCSTVKRLSDVQRLPKCTSRPGKTKKGRLPTVAIDVYVIIYIKLSLKFIKNEYLYCSLSTVYTNEKLTNQGKWNSASVHSYDMLTWCLKINAKQTNQKPNAFSLVVKVLKLRYDVLRDGACAFVVKKSIRWSRKIMHNRKRDGDGRLIDRRRKKKILQCF